MRKITRRQFVRGTAVAGATLAFDRAPAFAQRRELTMLSGSHFVPPSDEELRRQGEAFARQAGITFKLDTIQGLQLPAKRAAEAQSQSGHDILLLSHADPFLFESQLVDMGPLVETLGKRYGGWYPFAAESAQTGADGARCRGTGSRSRRRTTWRTSGRPASSTRRPGTSS